MFSGVSCGSRSPPRRPVSESRTWSAAGSWPRRLRSRFPTLAGIGYSTRSMTACSFCARARLHCELRESMNLESAEFRRILGHWVTGVSIVTAQPAGRAPCGLTANSFCSVSLEPPLVLVCVEGVADTHNCIVAAGAFCVNVLDSEHEVLARRFADQDVAEKFRALAYRTEQTGAPVLQDALAWVDCRV